MDKNKVETNQFNVSHTAACPEPWWNTMGSMGYSSISPAMMRGSASDSSSLEQSMDGHSQSDSRMNDDDDDDAAGRHSQSAVNQQSGIFGRFFFFFFFFLPLQSIGRRMILFSHTVCELILNLLDISLSTKMYSCMKCFSGALLFILMHYFLCFGHEVVVWFWKIIMEIRFASMKYY